MAHEQVIQILTAERDRLTAAIALLQGETKRRGRPRKDASAPEWVTGKPKVKRKARKFTKAQAKAQSERMTRLWAERRAAKGGKKKAAKAE